MENFSYLCSVIIKCIVMALFDFLKSKSDKQSENVATLKQQIISLREEVTSVEKKKEDLQSQVKELEKKANQRTNEIERLEMQKEKTKREVDDMQSTYDRLSSSICEVRKENEFLCQKKKECDHES